MTAKSFQFEVWLQGTEAQQQAERERQALALAAHSRAKLSESERLIGRGALLEATARANLEQSAGVDKEARILAQNQLADALAMQGRYSEAAETHNDKHRRKHFRDIGKALEMDDNEKCKCPDTKAKIDGAELSITPRFEQARIFSPVHNDLVSLVRCRKCGHLNARPLRSRLLKHNAALNESERAKRPVQSDAQVLNAKPQV